MQSYGATGRAGSQTLDGVPVPTHIQEYRPRRELDRFKWTEPRQDEPEVIWEPETPKARLTPQQIEARNILIVADYIKGVPRKELPERYNTSYTTINNVLRDAGFQIKASPSQPFSGVKVCPWCNEEFSRREGERTSSWNARRFCCRGHGRMYTAREIREEKSQKIHGV